MEKMIPVLKLVYHAMFRKRVEDIERNRIGKKKKKQSWESKLSFETKID